MDEPAKTFPPSASRLSKTPSWVTLGFVLGVLFMWALPQAEKTVTPAASQNLAVQLLRPKMTEIEAVFAVWGRFAVWDNDLTEVALWDVDKRSYSICYEVLRSGEVLYFRSIPRLTRPVLTHGIHVDSPLLYTETEGMRREWLDRDQHQSPAKDAVPVPGKTSFSHAHRQSPDPVVQ